jgi:dihydroorotase
MSSELLRFDLIIRGGTVVDPAAARHGVFDLGITNGRIAAVEPALGRGGKAQSRENGVH